MFRKRGAAVDQIRGIGLIGRHKPANSDAKQTESCSIRFALEKHAGSSKDASGELRRCFERLRTRANLEIRGLEFDGHCHARQFVVLEPRRHLLAKSPQDAFKAAEIADITLEGCLGGYALGLARRIDFSLIDAVRQPPKTPAFLAVAAHQFDFTCALQVSNALKAIAGKTRGADCAHSEDETDRF